MSITKDTTLLFLRRDGELLLAMKKRGFGVGKWNAPGGKAEPGETPKQAAIRECEEEVGVTPQKLQKVGEIDFKMTHDPQFNHYIYIYVAEQWEGEPHETEEMRPQWFALDALPYDDMWPADNRWIPLLLAGKHFAGAITLGPDESVVRYEMHEIAA